MRWGTQRLYLGKRPSHIGERHSGGQFHPHWLGTAHLQVAEPDFVAGSASVAVGITGFLWQGRGACRHTHR